MNTLVTYFERTIYGMREYFREDKIVVLLLAAFLYLWLKEKKKVDNKGNRMLVYALLMAAVLLIPFTAIVIVIYQTAFYDYAWAWSMVPVAAIIGYAVVVLYGETMEKTTGVRKLVLPALILLVFFLCGNQGTIQRNEESDFRSQTKLITEYATQQATDSRPVLWAPQNILQEVRRESGEILLIYGRDMWDEKAGAYDYEAYSRELVEAYEWLELVDLLAQEAEDERLFEVLCQEYELEKDAGRHIGTMLEQGVTVMAVPRIASGMFEEMLSRALEESALVVEEVYTEQYAVYLLK